MNKQTIQLSATIHAPKETVWATMLNDDTYRQWAAAFCEGSYYNGTWAEGSTMRFLSPQGDGLLTEILEHKPAERIVAQHIGALKDGHPVEGAPQAESWAGFQERYYVEEQDGRTVLRVEQEIAPQHAAWFEEHWQDAIRRLKTLAEGQAAFS